MKGLGKLKVTTQHGTCMEVTSQKCDLFLVVKSGVGFQREEGGGLIWRELYNSRCLQRQPLKKVAQKAYRFKGALVVVGLSWGVTEANSG